MIWARSIRTSEASSLDMRQEIGHHFTMTQATFTTETGSMYRIDYGARTCERLTGKGPATARVGSGARRFESITDLQVGAPVLINWGEFSATPSDGRRESVHAHESRGRDRAWIIRRLHVDSGLQPVRRCCMMSEP